MQATRLALPRKFLFAALSGLMSFQVLADSYDEGLAAYTEGNYAQAVQYFQSAAAAGDAGAQHMLMRMYQDGKGVSQDADQSFKWSKQAAERGMVQAQFTLAENYRYGRGTKQDMKQAFYWYQQAANQGHHIAMENLASFYENGDFVSQDMQTAKRLYLYAASEYDVFAQKGDPGAQNSLAQMYEQGKGVAFDMMLAMEWYKKSALQDYALAQFNLGRVLAAGNKVDRNIAEAAYWLEQAAQQGLPQAQALLTDLRQEFGTNLAMR